MCSLQTSSLSTICGMLDHVARFTWSNPQPSYRVQGCITSSRILDFSLSAVLFSFVALVVCFGNIRRCILRSLSSCGWRFMAFTVHGGHGDRQPDSRHEPSDAQHLGICQGSCVCCVEGVHARATGADVHALVNNVPDLHNLANNLRRWGHGSMWGFNLRGVVDVDVKMICVTNRATIPPLQQ